MDGGWKEDIKEVTIKVFPVEQIIRNHGKQFYRNRCFVSILQNKGRYNIRMDPCGVKEGGKVRKMSF